MTVVWLRSRVTNAFASHEPQREGRLGALQLTVPRWLHVLMHFFPTENVQGLSLNKLRCRFSISVVSADACCGT